MNGTRAAVALTFLILAGCVAPHENPSASAVTTQAAQPVSDHLASPTPAAGKMTDLGFEGLPYTISCKQARIFFDVPIEEAQRLLPNGWRAADARELHRLLGLPDPGADTQQGVVGYDAAECPQGTLDGKPTPIEFSNIAVAVQTPRFTGKTSITAANAEFYDVDLLVKSEAWLALLERMDFGGRQQGSEITVRLGIGPNGAGAGDVTVAVGGTTYAAFSWASPTTATYSIPTLRLWHSGERGTGFAEFSVTDELGPAPVTSCSQAAGSPHRNVTGLADCNGASAFVVTGAATEASGRATWMPGAFPI